MRQQQMTRLIHSLPQLTHRQRQQLASCLQVLMDRSQASAIIEAHSSEGRACPHCASSLLVKNGLANGLQRFKGIATKYLDSYLGWFRLLDRSGPKGPQPALVLDAAVGN